MAFNQPPQFQQQQTSTFGFEGVILGALSEIHRLSYQCFSSGDEQKVLGFQASIIVFHAYLAPYYDKRYKEKVFTGYQNGAGKKIDSIKKRLEECGAREEQKKLKILEEWLIEIVKRFGRIGILPAIETEETVEMDTQKEWTEREKVLKKALALVKKHGPQLQQALKQDGTIEKVIFKKEKDFYLRELPERFDKERLVRRIKVD